MSKDQKAIANNGNNGRLGHENDDNDYKFGSKFGNRDDEGEDLKRIQEKIGHVENESLASTQRCLRMINETHEIGTKTAEELVRQGEKLDGIDSKLDHVDKTLNATQRNLNQLKSVFGGLKNKFFGGKASKAEQASQIDAVKKEKETPSSSKSSSGISSSSSGSNLTRGEQAVISGSDREKEINSNLDDMSVGLSRLKSLAQGMSAEIDRQNPILDRLNDKTVKTNTKIDTQHAEIKRILK